MEEFTDRAGLERVETRGGLVQHHEGWVRHKLNTDGGTLALTTGEHLSMNATNLGVLNVVKTQFSNDFVHEDVLLSNWGLQSKTSGESERLQARKVGEENIVLHDVGGVASEGVLVNWNLIVEHNGAGKLCLVDEGNTVGENVEQRSFTGTGGTKDISGYTGCAIARAVFDNHFATVLCTAGHFGLLLAVLDFDLELNVLPAELDWVFAEFLCVFNEFLHISVSSSCERLRARLWCFCIKQFLLGMRSALLCRDHRFNGHLASLARSAVAGLRAFNDLIAK